MAPTAAVAPQTGGPAGAAAPTAAPSGAGGDPAPQTLAALAATKARALVSALSNAEAGSAAQRLAARALQAWCESRVLAGADAAALDDEEASESAAALSAEALLAAGAVPALVGVVQSVHVEATVLAALRALEALAEGGGPACRAAMHAQDALPLLRRQWRNWWSSPERGAAASLCARLTADADALAAALGGAPPASASAAVAAVAPLLNRQAFADDVVTDAVAALRRWACCGPAVRRRLVSAGAVPALAALLGGPACATSLAADALAELCAQPGLQEMQAAGPTFDDAAAARAALAAGALPATVALLQGAGGALLAEVASGLCYDLLRGGGAQAVAELTRLGGLETLAQLARGSAGPAAAAAAANCANWIGGWRESDDDVAAQDAGDAAAWVAAGGVEALLLLAEGVGRNDHGAHSAAVALGHLLSLGRLSAQLEAALPPTRVAAALLPLLRGDAGAGASRHAASTMRHLMRLPEHRKAAVSAGMPAAAVAALAAALREPLFPPRAGAGGAGGDGARAAQHHLLPLHTLVAALCPALPLPGLDAVGVPTADALKQHVRVALLRTPGALAAAAHVLATAGAPHTGGALLVLRRNLGLLRCWVADDPEGLALDEHFAFGAALAAQGLDAAAVNAPGNDVAGIDYTAAALRLTLEHPPPGREAAAAATIAHLSEWFGARRRFHVVQVPRRAVRRLASLWREVLAGGTRLEVLLGALLHAAQMQQGEASAEPFNAWRCVALTNAVAAAANAAGMTRAQQQQAAEDDDNDTDSAASDDDGEAGSRDDRARPRKRQRTDDAPGSSPDLDMPGATAVFLVAGRRVRADAAALARSSRLVSRLLSDAPPGPAVPVPLPPVAGVPDAMQPQLFALALRHASGLVIEGDASAEVSPEAALPLWILACFLEMDDLKVWAVAAMERCGALRDRATLLAAWGEAARRPETEGLQAACAREALAQLTADRPGALQLLSRMQAAADTPGALLEHLAREMRAALIAANATPGGPWGDEVEDDHDPVAEYEEPPVLPPFFFLDD